jgi:riboflavin kinase/FMN adenylyltransferase
MFWTMAIHLQSLDQPVPAACQGGAVTIGNFDGVHRGHQALLAELARQARRLPGPAVALTFDPHPLQLLRPAQFQPVLTTRAERGRLLQLYGAEQVVVLQTTPAMLQLSAETFFERVLRGGVKARAVVPGFNFAFGRNREGNLDTLAALCKRAGMIFTPVPPLEQEGRPVSSSRVREALLRGAVREAAGLLDRPYRLYGTVGTGQRRGQTLGFPTANLEKVETLVPGNGVYAVRVLWGDQTWPGAANIGPNPTFGEQTRKVEVHLIGFQGDLYGAELAVEFIERLRETRPFPDASSLIAQLHADVEQAHQLLSAG